MLGYENSADERSPLKKLSPDSGQQVKKVALVQWGVLVDDIRITRTLLSQGYNLGPAYAPRAGQSTFLTSAAKASGSLSVACD